jgi:hypothetical protein
MDPTMVQAKFFHRKVERNQDLCARVIIPEYGRVIKFERPVLKYRCRYLDENSMLLFNIDGVDMPCCFIKNVDQYESREHSE